MRDFDKEPLRAVGLVLFAIAGALGCGSASEESPSSARGERSGPSNASTSGRARTDRAESDPATPIDSADQAPDKFSGAGVGGAPLRGALRVSVVDARERPLPDATVVVGRMQARTDAEGIASFEDDALTAPVTITAQADGYAASTVIGVRSELAKLALAPYPRRIATATVSGSIELPSPAVGQYTAALILYSHTAQFGAPENAIAQPMEGDAAQNLCVRASTLGPSTCNWRMNVRTGRQVHYAIVVTGSPGSSLTDTSDDSYELLGYAIQPDVDVHEGDSIRDVRLTMSPATDLTTLSIEMPSAPSGLSTRIAFPFIDLGDRGQLVFPLPTVRPGSDVARLPALSGALAGGHYRVVGLATPTLGAAHPFSSSFAHEVGGGSVSLPEFLDVPGVPSGGAGAYRFEPAAGASFHLASFVDGERGSRWSVLLLDDADGFQLPDLDEDPLAGSRVELTVSAIELPDFDKTDFSFERFNQEIARVSESSASVDP
jgi:hypothetical protein